MQPRDEKAKKPSSSGEVVPQPEEVFWKRYSPNHECFLSWVGSVTLHGLVVGLLFLIALTIAWARHSEQKRPPTMDVVQLEGGGDGLEEGEGAAPGGPAGLPESKKTEAVGAEARQDPNPMAPEATPRLKDLSIHPQLDIPTISSADNSPGDLAIEELDKITAEADRAVKQAMKIPVVAQAPAKGNPGGTGRKNGQGGRGGVGKGPGTGRKGSGLGSGLGGRPLTRPEILARRWRFDLSGPPREHAEKIDAVGFILAIPAPGGSFRLIRDLKRRPVQPKNEDLTPFKDAVKWFNVRQDSVQGLAQELRLPFVPPYVVLLLPKDREEKMAEAEERFARSHGRSLKTIRATWFDFRLRGGTFEPVVLRQE